MFLFFFFNDTATTEIYTLSLHDALPISDDQHHQHAVVELDRDAGDDPDVGPLRQRARHPDDRRGVDRKSTRLNSSHANISYAVFCLKKKKNNEITSLQL